MTQRIASRTFIYIALIVGAVVMIGPFIFLVSTALMPDTYVLTIPPTFIPVHPTLQNFVDVWSGQNFAHYFLNSLIVASTSTAITVLFSSMLAFAFARYSFPGRSTIFYCMLITLMLPTLVLIIPQF